MLCAVLAVAIAWQLGWLEGLKAPPAPPLPKPAKQHARNFTPPPGWIRMKVGDAFTFYAPPGAVLSAPDQEKSTGRNVADLPGIDAYVGHVDAPGLSLRFDYGSSDEDLSFAAAGKDTLEEALIVDARDASLITARDLPRTVSFAPDKPYFVGLLVTRVTPRTAYYGLSDVVWNHLRFFGYGKTQADAETVKQMLKTIEFTAPVPE